MQRRMFLASFGAASITGVTVGCLGEEDEGDDEPVDDTDDGDAGNGDDAGADGDDGNGDSNDDAGGEFPTDPINNVIPFGEGGGTDTYFRGLQPFLEDAWGVDTTAEYLPGAGEMRGLAAAYHADPDGHTVIWNSAPHNPSALEPDDQPIDIADMEPVGGFARSGFALVTRPEDNVEDFDDLAARFAEGEYSLFAGGGAGSGQWMTGQLLELEGHLEWDEYVTYESSGEIVRAVIGGEADVGVPTDTTAAEFSDEVDIIVVAMPEESPVLPGVPTLEEVGADIPYLGFMRGINTTPEVPDDRLEVLQDGFEEAVTSEQAQEWADENDLVLDYYTPEEWASEFNEGHQRIIEETDIEALRDRYG